MKFLFDLFPVILFFVAFRVAEANKEAAALSATHWFGWMVSGGAVDAKQGPILWATVLAIVATSCQVGWLLLRRKRVHGMLWASLIIVAVFGGATIWFHNETFIKWKPTVLYWLFGAVLVFSQTVLRKNLIRSVMEQQISLPDTVWQRLNLAWVAFFSLMGVLNLYVAFSYPTETWVSFKLFAVAALTPAFVVVQALFLGRYVKEPADAADDVHGGTG